MPSCAAKTPTRCGPRIAALGWKAQERFTVMVGNSPSEPSASYVSELRRTAGRFAEDALVGIQGDRLILILGGVHDRETAYLKLSELFAPGPVVYGAEGGLPARGQRLRPVRLRRPHRGPRLALRAAPGSGR